MPDKGKTLLIPGSSRTGTLSYPVAGIEAFRQTYNNQTDWLPNYFAFAAKFAVSHYRGAQKNNWVVAAMNSANRRTQDQLHIHMCNLATNVTIPTPPTRDAWTEPRTIVQGKARYHVMQLSEAVTEGHPLSNPFTKVFMPEAPKGGAGGEDQRNRAEVALALVIRPTGTNYLLYSTDHDAVPDHDLLPTTCDYK